MKTNTGVARGYATDKETATAAAMAVCPDGKESEPLKLK